MVKFTAKDEAITVFCGDIFQFEGHNMGSFDCVFDHGSVGSFHSSERSKYVEIMKTFMKPGGRMLLSVFDYKQSEHPTIPFAVTEEEVVGLFKESFDPPRVLEEIDADRTADIFHMYNRVLLFPVKTFSHFSWKIYLLVKQ